MGESVSGGPTLQATLLANTSALFAAFQHRDIARFLAGVTPDFTYVGPEGVLLTEELASVVQDCGLGQYSIRAPLLRMLSPDAAVLIYRHHQQATCHGRPLPAEMLATDSYLRKNGRWLISVHTETASQ